MINLNSSWSYQFIRLGLLHWVYKEHWQEKDGRMISTECKLSGTKWFFRLFLRSRKTMNEHFFNSIEWSSWQSWHSFQVVSLSCWLWNVSFGFSSLQSFKSKALLRLGRISISPFFDRPESLPTKYNANCCMAKPNWLLSCFESIIWNI